MKRGFILGPWTYREVGKHLEKCGLVEGSWKKKTALKRGWRIPLCISLLVLGQGKRLCSSCNHVQMLRCLLRRFWSLKRCKEKCSFLLPKVVVISSTWCRPTNTERFAFHTCLYSFSRLLLFQIHPHSNIW